MNDHPGPAFNRGLRNAILPSIFLWIMIIMFPLATLLTFLTLVVVTAVVCAFWDPIYNYFHHNDEKGLHTPRRRR